MWDDILVGVDGSTPARAALEHASDVAEAVGATIHVLTVANTNELRVTRIGTEVVDAQEQEREEIVASALDCARSRDIHAVGEAAQGAPREVILERAHSESIDVVVLGAHGRHDFSEYVLGSVTEYVVKLCETPILTVGDLPEERLFYPYDDVLAPIDGSANAWNEVEAAAEIASRADATLHLLSVVDDRSAGTDESSSAARSRLDESTRRLLEDTDGIADGAGVDSVVSNVRVGSVTDEIQAYTNAECVDLIVMNTHGRSGITQHLLGSVTERTIRTAPAPVLTIPGPGPA